MIKKFHSMKNAGRLVFSHERVKPFEASRRQAERTLDRLEAATGLGNIANFPGHRLKKLKGDRGGTYSIRINDR